MNQICLKANQPHSLNTHYDSLSFSFITFFSLKSAHELSFKEKDITLSPTQFRTNQIELHSNNNAATPPRKTHVNTCFPKRLPASSYSSKQRWPIHLTRKSLQKPSVFILIKKNKGGLPRWFSG